MNITEPVPETYGNITFDNFYPEISIDDFFATMKLGAGSITKPRLINALTDAFMKVEENLIDERCTWANEGQTSLANIPAPLVNGVSFKVRYWQTAIYNFAAANLVMDHQDMGATPESYLIDESRNHRPADLSRRANEAIRALKSRPRIDCDLL